MAGALRLLWPGGFMSVSKRFERRLLASPLCPHPHCLMLGLAGTVAHGFCACPNLLGQPTTAGLPEFDEEFEETRNALSERA
eukprot:5518183-Pyramimonas_sp.AAC.1